jgi:hypothetical protein
VRDRAGVEVRSDDAWSNTAMIWTPRCKPLSAQLLGCASFGGHVDEVKEA